MILEILEQIYELQFCIIIAFAWLNIVAFVVFVYFDHWKSKVNKHLNL